MTITFARKLLRTALGASALLAAAAAFAATTTVSLTAQQMSTALPDGTTVPMWGYCATGTCSTAWAPGPTIVVPAGDDLVINLTNSLPVPTSIVVLGQLGAGLGSPTRMNSPDHKTQTQTTWAANGAGDPKGFTPPAQGQRVLSMATEVASGAPVAQLTWSSLKPGTYIYETGTLPSIQAPMGLYGVLIVTTAPVAADTTLSTPFVPGKAYPGRSNEVAYDADVALLFSEIDPVQNRAVDAAASVNADVNMRFDDPSCTPAAPCYPAAVNYSPTYFLINGKSFDKAAPEASAFAIAGSSTAAGTAVTGNLLVRFLNAGLRTHIPSIVGVPLSIVAEDGSVAPGKPKVQNEVLLTAGKTHDVLIKAANAGGVYTASNYPLFDRALGMSTGPTPDGGMQGFLQVAGGALPASAAANFIKPTAVADMFPVPPNASMNGNVRTNDIAVTNAAVVSTTSHGDLSFYSDGSFVYTPAANFVGTDTFTYNGNNGTTNTVTVTLNVGTATNGAGAPIAVADSFSSNVAGRISVSGPGVLANDTDPNNFVLTAALVNKGTCANVALNANGSFTASNAGSCQFTYVAVNSKNVASTPVTVNVSVPAAGSGLQVTVLDPATKAAITDYSWIIQEDLTFKVDPTGTPSLDTRTLGTSFHKAHMNVVATGCVGAVSCGAGQMLRGSAVAARPDSPPGDVVLDPTKHYYISILPGDAAGAADGSDGHGMGATGIKPGQLAVTINSNAYAWQPAQLSIYIYEDNAPVNNQNDQDELGLGGFNIILVDAVGRSGDPAGQQTFDASGMPLSNSLLGRPGCPDTQNQITNGTGTSATGNIVGAVYTCPEPSAQEIADAVAADGPNSTVNIDALNAKYALRGHALIQNLTPARYDVIAHPAAARQGAGEVWWQVETLEGTPAQDAFTGVKEPVYFQEFGPPGFHTTIGFVNPDRVKKYATDNNLIGTGTITGKITNQHMSRPSDVTLYDSGAYDLLSSTTCQVALNSAAGDGPAIAITQCDRDGNFSLTNVPAGDYEIAIWDQWLDQIIQFQAVTVPATPNATVAMGSIPVLSWFTQYDQNIFMDANNNGIYDAGEKGISNVTMTTRYRDGGISNQTATDSNGNGLLAELFPLFNWYVTEADTTRFKQTGVNVIVDTGGPTDTTGDGVGLWSSTYKDCVFDAANPTALNPCSSNRVEMPGAYSYGIQGFISQRNTINWGRAPYAVQENGGIAGYVVYSTTRPFDDQRYNVQTLWEPLVPRVTMNLYRKEKLADGTETLTLVDSTKTSSFDDFVNAVDASGKQINMQCPGQDPNDPFFKYTLNGTDQFRCYDGWHDWNQVQAAPYDGRYQFPSAAYIAAHPLTDAQKAAGQTLVSLPAGQYVVEAVTPQGFDIVKEEDKNILNGDSFVAPAVTQFYGIGNVFILPDQATLNNANPYSPKNADGIQNNATSNLGVTSSWLTFPDCVGAMHRVPDFLSLFPQGGLVSPFAGMDRPLCDRKLVSLNDQQQASATFFVFTQVPMAANGTGIILDDASSEFNAAAPDFGEKASVAFVPVSIKDFNGVEINRFYSDQWGAYNVMTPSSWLVNPPTPSGYGPNMLVTCMNDPGPIAQLDANGVPTGKLVVDPQYNPAYSNFCYTLPFMPGRTTYLDTPVLPIAAFAAGYNPADCEYPDATPAIARVDGVSAVGFGPYVPAAGADLTITALGDIDVQNPAYAGPFAAPGTPASLRTVKRHYGFGAQGTKGTVTIGGVAQTVKSWTDSAITVTVAAGTVTGELVINADNGKSSVDAVTVTVGGSTPKSVRAASGQTIQAAIDAATPGDLILIDAGIYNELVIMWKPVRLQGVGAASVIINAAKYPTSKLETWRPTINSLFSVDITTGNLIGTPQIDPLPTQEITGGLVLLEPTVLGTEQGAGITVLAAQPDLALCGNSTPSTFSTDNGVTFHTKQESNFSCVPAGQARIDGLSITGGDAGGGIYVNGWAHNLEISNNRVYGNAGAFHGGVRIGVPYLELDALPTTAAGAIVGFGYDNNVKIHHNAITKNGTVEGPAGAGGAGGGVSICSGSDGYSVDHNWICGNYSSSDGGGIGHLGFSQGGTINNNTILFNQSFQQTASTHGGGIFVGGEPALAATLPLGTGNLTIDANVIRGNFAEGGQGGGIRLQQVNGADVELFPADKTKWFKVTATNNMVVNNVAGWAGGGIAIADTLSSVIDNNTVVSNDSAGIAGTVLGGGVPLPAATPNVAGIGTPSAAGVSTELTSAQLQAAVAAALRSGTVISKPALVNNIVWHNRSFFYNVVSGQSSLCSNDGTDQVCHSVPDQAFSGECTGTPAYWDLGVVGDTSRTSGALKLTPTYTVLSSTVGYPGAGNTANDPMLASVYCNGSRVTPEFAAVINPPSIKNLQVAATTDEGNNYVSLRFGPLYLAKPTDATGSTHVEFGDYHFAATATAANSAARDHGTTGVSTHDIDNQIRPQGAAWDIGADEFAVPMPAPSVAPAALAFGAVSINTFKTLTVTVTNGSTATANLILATPTLTAGASGSSQPAKYTFTTTCTIGGAGLAPNTSCAITVTFAPTQVTFPTLQTATLNVNATNAPAITVPMSGTGVIPVYSIAPGSATGHNFGNQGVGTQSAPFQFTVTNSGPAGEVWFTGNPVLSGGSANQFQAAFRTGDSCTATTHLATGGSCTLSVIFAPTTAGNKGTSAFNAGARVDVTHAAGAVNSGLVGSPVWGTGVAGTVAASPNPVAFGARSTLAGATSQVVTVNVSVAAVTFSADAVTGTNFTKGADSCAGTTVQPGNSCSVTVTFTPTAANATTASTSRTGTLAISSNASTATLNVSITGTATQAVVGFSGTTALTSAPATRAVKNVTTTITNSGSAPLVIGSFAIAANAGQTNPGTYSVVNTVGATACPIGGAGLAVGATCQLTVTYSPPAAGALNTINGTLTLTDTGAFAATQTRAYTGN